MRKKIVWTTAATALLFGIAAYWVLSGFSMPGTMTYDLRGSGPSQHVGQSWRQKAGQVLLPLLYSHDTQYAARYREEAFRTVRAGATEEEIRAALGDPLDKTKLEDGRIMWHYTKPGPNPGFSCTHYRIRRSEASTSDLCGVLRRLKRA